MKVCGHHRQKLEDGSLLPCAVPDCEDGLPMVGELLLNAPGGPRRYLRECARLRVKRKPRTLFTWREMPLQQEEAAGESPRP